MSLFKFLFGYWVHSGSLTNGPKKQDMKVQLIRIIIFSSIIYVFNFTLYFIDLWNLFIQEYLEVTI